MKTGLWVRPEAESDLREAYRWYEGQRPGLGDDFLLCVDAALSAIQANPLAFPAIHQEVRRVLVRRFPYGVFYVHRGQTLTILAVFHCHRDPSAWQGRATSGRSLRDR